MDIKSMSQIMQLYMMNNMIAGDDNSTTASSPNSDMFNLLLEEMLMGSQGQTPLNTGSPDAVGTIIAGDGSNNYNQSVNLNSGSGSGTNEEINNAVEQASQKYGVDPSFIKAIIGQESGFHPNAVSGAGAEGLMQLMPKTAESLGVENPFDVLQNIDGGTKYIKKLIDGFGGNKELALAAYNGGVGRMNRLGVDNTGEINRMPAETQNYVAKVMKKYEDYKNI